MPRGYATNDCRRLVLERLEDRLAPATWVVDDPGSESAADAFASPKTASEHITLASVFEYINSRGGSHTITFSGPMRIGSDGANYSYEKPHPDPWNRVHPVPGALHIKGIKTASGPGVVILGSVQLLTDGSSISDVEIESTDASNALTVGNRATVADNVIHTSHPWDYGLYLRGNDNTVTNNIVGLRADGVTPADGGRIEFVGSNNRIINNTVSLQIWGHGGSTVIRNTVIQGNRIGTTADGGSALSLPVSAGAAGIRLLNVTGSEVGGLRAGQGNVVAGEPGGSGIGVTGAALPGGAVAVNTIQGNFVGTLVDGNTAAPAADPTKPRLVVGIGYDQGGTGRATIENNVVGSSEIGISVYAPAGARRDGTKVISNNVGVGDDGLTSLPNTDGVVIDGGAGVVIGGASPRWGNIISANTRDGIRLTGGTTDNQILGNYIGTNATASTPNGSVAAGTVDLGNGRHGIWIEDGSDNLIGVTSRTAKVSRFSANTISFNGFLADLSKNERGHAIQIDVGERNTVRGNSFAHNKGLSLMLSPETALPENDVGNGRDIPYDSDPGPNLMQNTPVVESLDLTGRTMTWQLISTPFQTFQIDFYTDSEVHPLGHGQGTQWLFTAPLDETKTHSNGLLEVTIPWVRNRLVTATATDPAGNTSVFSLVDSDADGLADGWEGPGNGVDYDMDGQIDQMLADADPQRKDVYLEADVVEQNIAPTEADTRARLARVAGAVANAFANAPASVANPNGATGVALHINPGAFDFSYIPLSELPANRAVELWSGFDQLRDTHFGPGTADPVLFAARQMVYRYAIFADASSQGGRVEDKSRGVSETGVLSTAHSLGGFGPVYSDEIFLGGNELLVTMPPNTYQETVGGSSVVHDDDLAGALMHELGHTLGLQHGGTDGMNFKPNYYSVMNYAWTVPDFLYHIGDTDTSYANSWTLDYSRVALPPLDRRSLLEGRTVISPASTPAAPNPLAGKVVPVYTASVDAQGVFIPPPNKFFPWRLVPLAGQEAGGYIDWNGNGRKDPLPVEVSLTGRGSGPLAGAEDWSRLVYNFRESPAAGDRHFSVEFEEHWFDGLAPGPHGPKAAEAVVVGADAGSDPRVQVVDPDGNITRDFLAFDAGFTGGVRVAKGDVNGDGTADIIAAMGPGGGTVRAFDGGTGGQLWSVTPYGAGYANGLNVAAGDTDKDGHAEVFVAPASGAGSTVAVLSGADGSKVRDILAYAATTQGGVTLAAGDVNGDGRADVITGLAAVPSPTIKVLNAADGKLIKSFTASSPAFTGVWVAAADVNRDGFADIIVAAGAGTTAASHPLVRVYSGKTKGLLYSFLADDRAFHGGVRVAPLKLVDGSYDLITGTGPGERVWRRFDALAMNIDWEAEAFDPGFSGVFVG